MKKLFDLNRDVLCYLISANFHHQSCLWFVIFQLIQSLEQTRLFLTVMINRTSFVLWHMMGQMIKKIKTCVSPCSFYLAKTVFKAEESFFLVNSCLSCIEFELPWWWSVYVWESLFKKKASHQQVTSCHLVWFLYVFLFKHSLHSHLLKNPAVGVAQVCVCRSIKGTCSIKASCRYWPWIQPNHIKESFSPP